MIDANIKNNKYYYAAGLCFLVYSGIELVDCVYIFLISFNIVPNIYLDMGIVMSEIQNLIKYQPIVFFPFFVSVTLLRLVSGIGIIKNRLYGFYMGIISLTTTMILTVFFIPFEIFFCTIILILLLVGRFGKETLID
jgi:alpha-N-acetylglucosamine transferase